MALQYVEALVGRVAVCGRPADAGTADLLYKAQVSVCKKAAGQRHPEIVVQPKRRAVRVRQNVGGNWFVHISFWNQNAFAGAAMVANLLQILADSDVLC